MPRLLDADELKGKTNTGYFHRMIDDCKTVDAVPVVRCKACRSCRELNRKDRLEDTYAEGCLWCMNWSAGVWPDDFCSYGESKDGGG